jgi:hypothetical protein
VTDAPDPGPPFHRSPPGSTRPRWSRWSRDASGYWLVLALIAVSYALCATQSSPNPSSVAFLVQLVTVAATLWVAEVRRPLRRAGWIVLTVAGVSVIVTQLVGGRGLVLDVVLSAASAVAYLAAPAAIIAHQIRRRRVDSQTLLGSVAAYVLVGMCFTFVYSLISLVSGTPTFGVGHPDSLSAQLFFSFTTLTTTGYGNLVPATALGQSVAILEAMAGQLFLVIAVARVVAGWERPVG